MAPLAIEAFTFFGLVLPIAFVIVLLLIITGRQPKAYDPTYEDLFGRPTPEEQADYEAADRYRQMHIKAQHRMREEKLKEQSHWRPYEFIFVDNEGMRKAQDEIRAKFYRAKDNGAHLQPTPGATARTTGPNRTRTLTETPDG